jgi:hypothetical protein
MDHLLSNRRHHSRNNGNCTDIRTSLPIATHRVWIVQVIVMFCVLALAPSHSQIIATALLAILPFSIITQTALLVANRGYGQ